MRDAIVATLATLVVLGALGGGYWLITNRSETDPTAAATAAVEDYLAAWEARDVAAMRDRVIDPTDTFLRLHREWFDTLAPTAVTLEHGRVDRDRGQATTPVTVTMQLPGPTEGPASSTAPPVAAGTMTYDSELVVRRDDGVWRVAWEPSVLHPELRASLSVDIVADRGQRAAIRAHDGTRLTGGGTAHVLGIEPRRIRDRGELVDAVTSLLPDAGERLARTLERSDLRPTWFYPFARLSEQEAGEVRRQLQRFPGVIERREDTRVRFGESFALHVLGRVGTLSADQATGREGRRAGDTAGLYGLERVFDERLTGGPSTRVVLRTTEDRIHSTIHETGRGTPAPLTTTLDATVQRAVENALLGVGSRTAVVAVDAATGAVRAAASRPLTGYNRAFEGRYVPGWAVTPVTAAALLGGGVGPDETVTCPAERIVAGRRITGAGDGSERALPGALATGCATGIAALAADLPAGALQDAAGRAGFGTEPQLPVDAFAGRFPRPPDAGARAVAAVGGEPVQASPLHLASVVAAAVSGTWHPARLIAPGDPAARGTGEPRRLGVDGLPELLRAAAGDLDVPAGWGGVAGTGPGEQSANAWFVAAGDGLGMAILVEDAGGPEPARRLGARVLRELAALRDGTPS